MGSFATGVTIVTARDQAGDPVGMTASSFNSVSMDPPLILWSVTKNALSAPAFHAADHFAVHVLSTDQTALANRFAKSGGEKFNSIEFEEDANGTPKLNGCATCFTCSTWAVYEGGDHWIIVGLVEALETAAKEGLVFGGGSYATAAPLTLVDEAVPVQNAVDTPLDGLMFYHLSRAYHQMSHQFHADVHKEGFTLAEWRLSASLYGEASCSFDELASRTFLDRTSMLDILLAMEARGLCTLSVAGGHAVIDGVATGTKKGSDQVARLFEIARKQEKETLTGTNDEDIARFLKILEKIVSRTHVNDFADM